MPVPAVNLSTYGDAVGPYVLMAFFFLAVPTSGAVAPMAFAEHAFMVFDDLLYRDKPNLRLLGLVPIAARGNLWRPGQSKDDVDDISVRAALEPYHTSNGFYYFDIDH